LAAFDIRDLFADAVGSVPSSAVGPNNETTYEHYNPVSQLDSTGVDLPTNVQVTNPNLEYDTEWSGVAYHVSTTGLETIWVVPDEAPRIEVYRLHASTYVNTGSSYELQPIRTITLTGFDTGPEGIAWQGGNDFAFVEEDAGTIYTTTISPSATSIAKSSMTAIALSPNPEDHQFSNDNDGLEGVAYDPLWENESEVTTGVYYVVKEIGTNQGVWRVEPNGDATMLSIPEFNSATTSSEELPDPVTGDYLDNDDMFADFSDVFFARPPGSGAEDLGMLFITSEFGREDVIRVDLNTNHVDQLVTKASVGDFADFVGDYPNVDAQRLGDTEDVLMKQLEGIALKPDGTEAFIVADDDQNKDGNDVIDYRWLMDVDIVDGADLDGDGGFFRDIGDIDLIHQQITTGSNSAMLPASAFDFDQDGNVDADDGLFFVQRVMQIPLGDANLDGEFDTADLTLVFSVGEYEDAIANNSTWAEGDWNFDADFTTSDLVVVTAEGRYQG
jgi:hypothetical protein